MSLRPVQAKLLRLYLKNQSANKMAGIVALVVEHLFGNLKALSSSLVLKTKRKKEKHSEIGWL
jgi:hypothetical protein